jgi:SAM-dependent methyltransferase
VSSAAGDREAAARLGDPVVWSDVENGAYSADLPVWEELAAASGGPVLELGCGSGRVALHLARLGFAVHAVDLVPELVEAVRERAALESLALAATLGDACNLEVEGLFQLVIAPMQLAHLIPEETRAAMIEGVTAKLAAGGSAAFAVLDAEAARSGHYENGVELLPDMLERDGWVYSSQPLEVRPAPSGGLEVVRRRQVVAPQGGLATGTEREWLRAMVPEEIESLGVRAGLRVEERREIPATDAHVGSTVVRLSSSPRISGTSRQSAA